MAVKSITLRTVEALKPGEAIWDNELKGFGARCQVARQDGQAGAISSVLKYRYKGRQRFYTIGRHGQPLDSDDRPQARQGAPGADCRG